MNRRQYLSLIGAAAIAGCATESDPGTWTGEPNPPVTLAARDATAQPADVSLELTYNSYAGPELPTDPATLADDGYKWLIVRCDVTNVGDTQRDLTMYQYLVESNGEQYETVQTKESWSLAEQSAGPGGTVTGWLVFQIPQETTEATLFVRGETQTTFEIRFKRDRSLTAEISN